MKKYNICWRIVRKQLTKGKTNQNKSELKRWRDYGKPVYLPVIVKSVVLLLASPAWNWTKFHGF